MKGKETGYAPRASRETQISRPLFKLNLHVPAPGARPARLAASLAPAALRAVQRGGRLPAPPPSHWPGRGRDLHAARRLAAGARLGDSPCARPGSRFAGSLTVTAAPARSARPAPAPPPTPPPPGSPPPGGVRGVRLRSPGKGLAPPPGGRGPELPVPAAAGKRSPELSPRFARRGAGRRQRGSSQGAF